ncbi:MAG: type III secretion system chaperone [Prosthecobacter sp.]|nr:type III secretion system chaperone [Prosthecobacter sp.]
MPEYPPSFASLLSSFATANNLPAEPLLLNPQVVVDGLPIGMIYEGINDFGDIVFFAEVGHIPAERSAMAWRLMLEGNHLWAATGGATLGLMEDGTATLCHRTPLAQLNTEALEDTLSLFAAQVQNWQAILGMEEAAAA